MHERQTIGGSFDINDLIQEGYIALAERIESYDTSRGVKFETYSYNRIIGSMLSYFREMAARSRQSYINIKIYNKAIDLARSECEGIISIEDIQRRTGFTLEQLAHVEQEAAHPFMVHIEELGRTTKKGEEKIALNFEGRSQNPENQTMSDSIKEYLLKGLNRNERLITILYYYENLSMKEVGKVLGLSGSRVSQIHKDLLKRWRERLPRIERAIA